MTGEEAGRGERWTQAVRLSPVVLPARIASAFMRKSSQRPASGPSRRVDRGGNVRHGGVTACCVRGASVPRTIWATVCQQSGKRKEGKGDPFPPLGKSATHGLVAQSCTKGRRCPPAPAACLGQRTAGKGHDSFVPMARRSKGLRRHGQSRTGGAPGTGRARPAERDPAGAACPGRGHAMDDSSTPSGELTPIECTIRTAGVLYPRRSAPGRSRNRGRWASIHPHQSSRHLFQQGAGGVRDRMAHTYIR